MATYNYIKAHWQNGPHAVHDAPDWVLASIEGTLSKTSRRAGGELVRIARDSEIELSIAWISCAVSLYTEDKASSYRRARYVHAIAMDDEDGTRLDAALAQQLFEKVYGTPIVAGVGSHQRVFGQLGHPDDQHVATRLFAETPRPRGVVEPLRRRGPGSCTGPSTSLSSLLTYQSSDPDIQPDDGEPASARATRPDPEAMEEQSAGACAEGSGAAPPPSALLESTRPDESPETDRGLATSGNGATLKTRRARRWAAAAGLLAVGIIVGAGIGLLLSPEHPAGNAQREALTSRIQGYRARVAEFEETMVSMQKKLDEAAVRSTTDQAEAPVEEAF